ncbi:DUF397 domain-containing protein [Streptomyces rubellomurinus]|uniref:Toxin n=1 Tax=Streptomyces rubellomurinus (strain ATCC 31215) TaxID=359131 RepID=A0A0F2T4W4_STRR3|nr:DUF397 domain-containing protein [Streptomyces rubellomurinus]KJS58233.1 toxin [Streptomyces rubellomurinus]
MLTWRKSSYSSNGGQCVEVALPWRKSSYSHQAGQCVEVAIGAPGRVPVRDSKDPEGPVLAFPADAWQSFVAAVRCGEFGDA